MNYALVFDLGTGSIKASLYNEKGSLIKSVNEDYLTFHNVNNIHEQNPNDWWYHLVSTCKILIKDFKDVKNIVGIAISGHSLGVVPISEDGKLLVERTPIWSDSRGEEFAKIFMQKINQEEWFNKTGNGFPPALYPLFKIAWIKKYQSEVYKKTYKFIGTKDYLNFKLSGVISTDRSYASGSGLYDILEHKYIKEFADILKIDINKFPEIRKSTEILGTILPETAKELGLDENTKIIAGGVDNACMTLGAGCYHEGDAYLSLGSSAWAACSSAKPNLNFKKTVYCWEHVVDGMYVPSCGIFSAGTSLEWARKNLLNDISYDEINKLVSKAPIGSNGLIFNPVMANGCGVDAATNMKGGLVNFDLNSTKEDVLRSIYEGIAYDLDLAFTALKNVDIIEPIRAVGGGSNSEIWTQIYADILGKDIVVSNVKREAATLACAGLVFVGTGIWKDFSIIGKLTKEGKTIHKNEKNSQLYNEEKKRFFLVCKQAAEIYK